MEDRVLAVTRFLPLFIEFNLLPLIYVNGVTPTTYLLIVLTARYVRLSVGGRECFAAPSS